MVMFIRHGEKPSKDGHSPLGVTPEGAPDVHSLLVRGWVRAGALIELFGGAQSGVERPDVVFAASAGDDASPHGKRASQTVTPLTLAGGIRLDSSFAVGEESDLAAEVSRQDGVVLVCWEHHNIPLIISALGLSDPAASKWPDDRFDLIWVLRHTEMSTYSFGTRGQALLDGDAPT